MPSYKCVFYEKYNRTNQFNCEIDFHRIVCANVTACKLCMIFG